MFSKTRKFFACFSLSLILSFFAFSYAIGQDMAAGKQIFETSCASCHKIGSVLIGPDLTGVKSRWKDEKKLIAFVRNSQQVIESGDPYAVSLYNKFNKTLMTPQDLTDQQIQDVLAYSDAGGTGAGNAAAAGGGAAGGGGGTMVAAASSGLFGLSYEATVILLLGLFILLLLIAITLYRIRTQLRRMGVTQEPAAPARKNRFREWWERNRAFYQRYGNVTFVVMSIVSILVLIGAIDLYDRAQDLGTQINYAPEQPIKFNHKLHAGQYDIQCQYCHTGVERGKQAGIPSISTCMNCHNYVEEGPMYGKEEIAKLRNAYKNRQPVKWVRIHNLPDHVYFNHSQHVVAGKVACASCHGAVQEMERVRQVSTLEMGWCINCHRETGVNTKNPYYTATYDFIKEHKKYTIGQLGGNECSKCHY